MSEDSEEYSIDDASSSDYVMIEKATTEWTEVDGDPIEVAAPFEELFHVCTSTHIFVVSVLYVSFGLTSHMLIDWNDLISLGIIMSLLLMQLIWSVDKLPLLRIRTQDYVNTPKAVIVATLEETIGDAKHAKKRTWCQRLFCCCCSTGKTMSYVITYKAPSAMYGRPVTVRKTLSSGVWDADLASSPDGFVELTKLICKEGDPLSAYPRHAIEEQHTRYKTWVLYFLPMLLLTIAVLLYNLWYANEMHWGTHSKWVLPMLYTFGSLTVLTVLPLMCYIRRFVYNVHYGGEEVSGEGSVVVSVSGSGEP